MSLALRIAGFLVAIAFCAFALYNGARDLPTIDWGRPSVWAFMASAFALYVVSQIVAAAAWTRTLAIFSVQLPPRRAETQLLVSQIGKYIPGNVAHLLGRLALAKADGVGGALVGLALLVEICLVLVAGGLLLALLVFFDPDLVRALSPDLDAVGSRRLSIALVAVLLSGIAVAGLFFVRQLHRGSQMSVQPHLAFKPLALHVLNFLILGLSLAMVAKAVAPGSVTGMALPVSVFAAAWTIGFLTPGAPGGIGVREGLIVLGLSASLGAGPALAIALLHRALAIAGDLTAFLLGLAFRTKKGRIKAERGV